MNVRRTNLRTLLIDLLLFYFYLKRQRENAFSSDGMKQLVLPNYENTILEFWNAFFIFMINNYLLRTNTSLRRDMN